MPSAAKPPEASSDFNLTQRERDVLSLLARGCSTEEIAEALSISVFTVRNHIQNILHKLQVHSRSAAVALAFERGLVAGDRRG
ncbi:MAG: response regulator transcription factor [Caldilineales bacterium]|nr:response regulator transcription factor [Caldilineales bacterium]